MRLATSVNDLSDALNSSAHEVMSMTIAQANAVRVTSGLVGTLQQMNETVMSALVDINATATRVNQTIGANLYSLSSNFLSLASAVVLSCESGHIPPAAAYPYRPSNSETISPSALGCIYGCQVTMVRFTEHTLFCRHGRPPLFSCLCVLR